MKKNLHDRTVEALVEKINANGGHWAELRVKATNELVTITRNGNSRSKDLTRDKFEISFPGSWKNYYRNLTIGEVADMLINRADHVRSSTEGDYSPSNPWDAPGMSVKDFI